MSKCQIMSMVTPVILDSGSLPRHPWWRKRKVQRQAVELRGISQFYRTPGWNQMVRRRALYPFNVRQGIRGTFPGILLHFP